MPQRRGARAECAAASHGERADVDGVAAGVGIRRGEVQRAGAGLDQFADAGAISDARADGHIIRACIHQSADRARERDRSVDDLIIGG
ncbi:MAG: hypothetical protein WCO71_08345, partial [Pseudomonadota bacterium]